MRIRTWKILDRGAVPGGAATISYSCRCGYEAELPVRGRALAQIGFGGVVFDNDGPYALPTTIQCRKCGRILTNEAE